MAKEGFKRKLTAIFSADVEGYSRLNSQRKDMLLLTRASFSLQNSLYLKHILL